MIHDNTNALAVLFTCVLDICSAPGLHWKHFFLILFVFCPASHGNIDCCVTQDTSVPGCRRAHCMLSTSVPRVKQPWKRLNTSSSSKMQNKVTLLTPPCTALFRERPSSLVWLLTGSKQSRRTWGRCIRKPDQLLWRHQHTTWSGGRPW